MRDDATMLGLLLVAVVPVVGSIRLPAPEVRGGRDDGAAAFLRRQPPGASLAEIFEGYAYQRAAGAPASKAAGIRAAGAALTRRHRAARFDVGAMSAEVADVLGGGGCACPLTEAECGDVTVYNNTLLHRPADSSVPMTLYYKDSQALDVMLAGADNCQPVQGFEVCDGSDAACVPSTESLFYDCEDAANVMLGVANVRGAELVDDDATVYDALSTQTNGGVTGDDDMFYGLSSQTVYVYALLELQGQVVCSAGCNFYDACKAACAGAATDVSDSQTVDLGDTGCTGTLEFVSPAPTPPPSTAAPSTARPSPAPAPLPMSSPLAAPTAVAAATEAPTAAALAVDDGIPATDDGTAATDDGTAATDDETAATDDETAATDDETAATDDETPATDDETPATDDESSATDDESSEAADDGSAIDRCSVWDAALSRYILPAGCDEVVNEDGTTTCECGLETGDDQGGAVDDDGGTGVPPGVLEDDGAAAPTPAPVVADGSATDDADARGSSKDDDDDDADAASGSLLVIIIIVVVLFLFVLLAAAYYVYRRSQESDDAPEAADAEQPPAIDVEDVAPEDAVVVAASSGAMVPSPAPLDGGAIKSKINEAEL